MEARGIRARRVNFQRRQHSVGRTPKTKKGSVLQNGTNRTAPTKKDVQIFRNPWNQEQYLLHAKREYTNRKF